MESTYSYHCKNNEDLSYYVFENVYYTTTPNTWIYLSEKDPKLEKIFFSPVEKKEFIEFKNLTSLPIENDAIEINIEDLTLITTTFSSFFAHSVLDHLFPIYYVLTNYFKDTNFDSNKVNFFIDKHKIRRFRQSKNVIDFQNQKYKNFLNDLLKPIVNKLVFQVGLGHNKILKFKKLIVGGCTNYVISPWINEYFLNYRKRKEIIGIKKKKIHLQHFKQKFNTYFKIEDKFNHNYVVLCNRKSVRGFTENSVNKLFLKLKELNINLYKEIVYFEDISLKESIFLMNNTKVFITPHGSNITNVLWMNSGLVIEIFPANDIREIYFKGLSSILGITYQSIIENKNTKSKKYDIFWNVNIDNIIENIKNIL